MTADGSLLCRECRCAALPLRVTEIADRKTVHVICERTATKPERLAL